MADIYQIHNQTGISIRSLNKLDKLGFLRVTKSDNPEAAKILMNLRKGNALTAGQLAMLHQEPKLFNHLGSHEYAARDALAEMGDVENDKAPVDIASMMTFAAARDRDSIAGCAAWLRSHMDASGDYVGKQSYRYVAVRMIAALPPHILVRNLSITSAAMLQIRKHPLMEGYSFTDEDGKTWFQRPISVDL